MKRLWCWLVGHDWKLVRENVTKSAALGHLHVWAGCDCDCRRCGAQWRDVEPIMHYHNVVCR